MIPMRKQAQRRVDSLVVSRWVSGAGVNIQRPLRPGVGYLDHVLAKPTHHLPLSRLLTPNGVCR